MLETIHIEHTNSNVYVALRAKPAGGLTPSLLEYREKGVVQTFNCGSLKLSPIIVETCYFRVGM